MTQDTDQVAYLAARLANAERIGRPAHIAHCRRRYEDAIARAASRDRDRALWAAGDPPPGSVAHASIIAAFKAAEAKR